ncbi:MAG TPA: pyridoxal-phosphate dependent enzyme, partial [Nannocystaceae bacterium]|nr:pyridoxal-phosphate dependent enzyme [Nannocystaceae bacterium]
MESPHIRGAEGWRALVDERFDAGASVLLRYHRVFGELGEGPPFTLDDLAPRSLGEGIAIRRLADRRGVEIFVADETQAMATGTYKALDACVTAAALGRAGVRRVVASSGGNLSAALGAYLQRAGVDALLFQPLTTLHKQDRRFFGGTAHLVCADLPEPAIKSLARAVYELGVPHPLHVHGCNLGVPGNLNTTLNTISGVEGLPMHLTHIQFHSYGAEGDRKFSSGAAQIAEAINNHPNITVDVGQILFGQTVTASGDSMRQFANH